VSTYTPVLVRCHHCGNEFTVEILEGIHITRLPEVRQEILDGRFQFFTCPSCSTVVHVENDTIFTDFDNKQYVAVQALALTDWREAKAEQAKVWTENFDLGPDVAREVSQGFVHRLVPDIAALREKLLIWDAGLDDRATEATKGARQRELGLQHWDELWRVSTVLEGGHLMFARLRPLPEGGFELLGHETVPNEAYVPWASGDEIEWEFSLLLDDWVVDLYLLAASTRPGLVPDEVPPGPNPRQWEWHEGDPTTSTPPPPLHPDPGWTPPPPPPPRSRVADESGPPPPPPPD
jgi:hypothetical protein